MKYLKDKYSDLFNLEYHYQYDSEFIYKVQKWLIIALSVFLLAFEASGFVSCKIHQSNLKSAQNAKIEAKNAKEKRNYKKQHFVQVKSDVEATMAKTEDDHMREVGNVDESKKAELKAPVEDDIKALKLEIKQLDKMPQDDDVSVLKTSIDNKLNLLN